MNGYIYIRDNEYYKTQNIYKLGITSSIKERDLTYATSEFKRGHFIYIVKVPLNKLRIIDKCLKNYFNPFNKYIDSGTEFYERQIINLIEPYLNKMNIEYKVLTKDEITNFIKT